MATSGFGNHTNPYSTLPLISAVQHPDVKNQLMHPSYNPATAISVNMVIDASARQKMQAMLAIQRQRHQFRHQFPVSRSIPLLRTVHSSLLVKKKS